MDRLSEAKKAQERIFRLRAEGVDMRSAEARQGVNRLMAQLRKLSVEEREAFDAWKAALEAGTGASDTEEV